MRLALSLIRVVGLAGAVGLLASCEVETTRYQAPEALKGKSVPEPKGAPAPGDVQVQERQCQTPVQPDPACGESWNALYTQLIKGAWKCTDAVCHGPSGGNQPIISDTDPQLARKQLTNFVLETDRAKTPQKFYIDNCSKDPAASSFMCNIKTESLSGVCNPGDTSMPFFGYRNVQGTAPTNADLQRFAKWLQCGAPAN